MDDITTIITALTLTLTVLQIAQIIASWLVYCEANASKQESVKSRLVAELTRQDTRDLQDTLSIQHIQRTPIIKDLKD